MIERATVLLEHLEKNDRYVEKLFGALATATDLRVSNPLLNHPLWLLTHIIEARYFVLRQLGVNKEPSWGDLSVEEEALNEPGAYPPVDELKAAWEETVGLLAGALGEVSEEAFSQTSSQKLPIEDTTLWGTISFLVHHETYHIGQLGSWYNQLFDGQLMSS